MSSRTLFGVCLWVALCWLSESSISTRVEVASPLAVRYFGVSWRTGDDKRNADRVAVASQARKQKRIGESEPWFPGSQQGQTRAIYMQCEIDTTQAFHSARESES